MKINGIFGDRRLIDTSSVSTRWRLRPGGGEQHGDRHRDAYRERSE